MPPRLDYTEIEINLRLNIITTNAARHLILRMDLNEGFYAMMVSSVFCISGGIRELYF